MTPPLVSCIIPVYNSERFIAAAVESILGQTHRPIEVIVVDDGSTDGTPAVLEQFSGLLRVIAQSNAGHAAARNAGIRASAGEYIAFLDADDLWHPDKLVRQTRRLAEHPELGVTFSHLLNFSGNPPPLGSNLPPATAGSVPGYTSVTMLARRTLFDTIGLFDEMLRHGNDRDWLLRAAEQGVQVDLLPDILVYRRLHDANRSAVLGGSSRAEYLRIIKASLDRRRAQSGHGSELDLGGGRHPGES
jgi:glycosyltransferase involved in cell wall biosynthesis